MFSKILIANRGEIACRVAATARRMGIASVAVYSEADARSRHVADSDQAVCIGAPPARESYLDGGKIIAAALATGAQAIHPGYGFLSENAEFAEACEAAGLTFIGPPASAIRAMGSKSAAKALMEQAGVPLVPGYHGASQNPALLKNEAERIGFPVLLKPSAGGGGKGMRVVERAAEFEDALASCRREAMNAFGDDTVLLEKYLLRPRHIEVQVFADTQGQCIALFERDCSVQRRYQKIIEEAPAPGMTDERRAQICQAAVAAAQAVGYVGAGTVEFIADQQGDFYFMEMNTRLQVEHPATEMVTGLDLVEWQLRVAAGEPLPSVQPTPRGHAIEARIYAENPDKGFLPSTGTLAHLAAPAAVQFSVGGGTTPAPVRIDSGVRAGDTITPYYDPMIAKLIVWGEDRAQAVGRLQQALKQWEVVGVASNLGFLQQLTTLPEWLAGQADTGLIERSQAALFPALGAPSREQLALASAALLHEEQLAQRDGWPDPWGTADGFRIQGQLHRLLGFGHASAGERHEVCLCYLPDGWRFECGGDGGIPLRLLQARRDGAALRLSLLLGQASLEGTVLREGDLFHVFAQGRHVQLRYHDALGTGSDSESGDSRLIAPMPGKVVAVPAAQGSEVKKGAVLIVMEAMKMEHAVTAPADGIVEELLYRVGDQVAEGVPLLVFQPH